MKILAVSRPAGTRSGSLRFKSTCPRCGKARSQRYNWDSLLRLLNGGYPVEAYCSMCADYWPIGVKERVRIGEMAVATRPGEH